MEKPVFVALDLDDEEKLNRILPKLGAPQETYLKIGMELFYNSGSQVVKKLVAQGYKIFLDLKLHDIPNTVYNGAKQLAGLGVYCITVHALGGSQMIGAAKDGLIAGTPNNQSVPKLLAVTELTSISDTILKYEQNCSLEMTDQVISLAKTAKKARADGVICSPLEVTKLRQEVGNDFLYVTPGIRPEGSANDDQVRTTTPKKAKELGASAIVVGRPITLASDPQAAYQAIKKEFN
ncbi:orotidine-5'-phosphate decarboxylase [Lactobacillus sp. ESL0791]|uniref:orotidine-5'-phosphate decarboxylase n=1 Tax=Lactobacillus sp. ESL0791 TaxID=2983234 RepID=UPI0023F6F240|nr:orotidine-5'-phosphate decarboxylase [Lactobacillus sp. ESL0791]MDF7639134.1 orotidine-5'-phosphate decarboxylase [Lactobacillus sp. ESL0791]